MSEAAEPVPASPECTCPPETPEGAFSVGCVPCNAFYQRVLDAMRGQLDGPPVEPVLDVDAVNAILAERAYKPGWTLFAYVGDTTRLVHLDIHALVEDSYNPGQQVPLHIVAPVPPFALENVLAFDKWLAWRLQQAEIHEAQEWYRKPRKSGEGWTPVFNPHRDGADRDRWPIEKR